MLLLLIIMVIFIYFLIIIIIYKNNDNNCNSYKIDINIIFNFINMVNALLFYL